MGNYENERATNIRCAMFTVAKRRAVKAGVPFTITRAEFYALLADAVYCPCCGVQYEHGRGRGPKHNSPTIDRTVPALGYAAGNLVVLCFRCNLLKSDASASELRRVADYIDRTWAE